MLMRTSFVLAAVLVGSVAQVGPPPAGRAMVAGRIVDGITGAPLTGVLVTLTGPTGSLPTVIVDSRGRFMFAKLPAGRITISADKLGYMNGGIGRTRADGQAQSLDLKDGELLTDLEIRLWRFGSIEGTVLDDAGEPVVGAWVSVFLRTWRGGYPSFSQFSSVAVTDDRGIYHFGQARPGDYVLEVSSRIDSFPMSFVEADNAARQDPQARQARTAELSVTRGSMMGASPTSPAIELDGYRITSADLRDGPLNTIGGRLWTYPSTFHPAARTPEAAQLVHVDPGQQRKGVDIRLTLVPTARISGVARGPDGPIRNLALRMSPAMPRWSLGNVAETVTDANGEFTFFGVPGGRYEISATTNASGTSPALWARQIVTATDRDLADVSVVLHRTLTVSGRIEFQGAGVRPAASQVRVQLALHPVDGGPSPVLLVDVDGNFRNVNITPGQYVVRVVGSTATAGVRTAAGASWFQRSAMFEGKDISEVPLVLDRDAEGIVVTFTDRPASLTGAVRSASGAPDPESSVLVFPTDPSRWINTGPALRSGPLQNVRVDREGVFATSTLPPGEYFAIALPDAATAAWQDPKFLERASSMATRVRIEEGQAARIDLRTQRW